MLASFLQTNFPEITLFKPKFFHLGLFGSSVVVLFAWLVVYIVSVCFLFCFCSFGFVWCFVFSLLQTLFVLWCIFGSSLFVLALLFCSLLLFQKWSWNVLCMRCLLLTTNSTDCLFESCCLVPFACFQVLYFLVLSFLATNRCTKDTHTHGSKIKTTTQKQKRRQNNLFQLAQLCQQRVFLILEGGLKNRFVLKTQKHLWL